MLRNIKKISKMKFSTFEIKLNNKQIILSHPKMFRQTSMLNRNTQQENQLYKHIKCIREDIKVKSLMWETPSKSQMHPCIPRICAFYITSTSDFLTMEAREIARQNRDSYATIRRRRCTIRCGGQQMPGPGAWPLSVQPDRNGRTASESEELIFYAFSCIQNSH